MRHIAAQDPSKIPREEEFKFRDRANALVEKWQSVVNPTGATEGTNGNATKTDAETPAADAAPTALTAIESDKVEANGTADMDTE